MAPEGELSLIMVSGRGIGLFLVVISCWISTGVVHAQDVDPVGQVVFVKGEASVQRNGDNEKPLSFGDDIYRQDILETGDGTLRVLFNDDTVLTLVSHSKVMVTEYVYRPAEGQRSTIFDVISGGIHAIVERIGTLTSSNVQFQTPIAVAGIRGTTLGVYHHPGQQSTHFLTFEGQLETYHRDFPEQRVLVNAGYITKVTDGPPQKPVPIPEDWDDFFSMDHISLHDVIHQRGAAGLDTLGDARLQETPGGGGALDNADATALNPPGFSGLPGALQEFPLPTTPVGGGPGGGGTGGAPGGGPGGGGTGGAPAPVDGPVTVQPTFPDPG